MLKKNIGTIDRMARIIIGVALLVLTYTGHIGLWGWVGIVPLLTALISSCPLYTLIGLNTLCSKCGDK